MVDLTETSLYACICIGSILLGVSGLVAAVRQKLLRSKQKERYRRWAYFCFYQTLSLIICLLLNMSKTCKLMLYYAIK